MVARAHPRRILAAAVVAAALAGCSADQAKEMAAGTFRSWCNQAGNCTVHGN